MLRILLTPAFHPEVCITIQRNSKSASISVVALKERFWASQPGVRLPCYQDESSLGIEQFDECVAKFSATNGGLDSDNSYIVIDGMGSESCLVSRETNQRFRGNVMAKKEIAEFVKGILQIAWITCKDPRVRNALAAAAWYVGVDYERMEEPVETQVTRLLALGEDDGRRDVIAAIQRRAKKSRV